MSDSIEKGVPTKPLMLVVLTTVVMFINYIDRGNLATAAPLMQEQMHLSASQLGILLSAFYYGYVALMMPAGWLAERYGAKPVLAVGVLIWSVATMLTGFATSFAMLLALRVLLGIGESAAFPCVSKILAHTVPVKKLGFANGVMSFGYLVGPAVGTLLGGLLMSALVRGDGSVVTLATAFMRSGWRPVFFIFGGLSLLWLIPWSRVRLGPPAETRAADDVQPTFKEILSQRALWGTALGLFGGNYSFYFILSWLPFYLVKARGFSIEGMAWIAAWAYLVNALASVFAGWASDRWVRRGGSPDTVYKGAMILNHGGGILCMVGMVLLPVTGSIICLFLEEIIIGLAAPGAFTIPQIIAGPKAAGRWVGVQNASGNLAGFIAPALTGILVDQSGNFIGAFVVAALVNVLGLVGWVWILPKVAPIDWAAARMQRSAKA